MTISCSSFLLAALFLLLMAPTLAPGFYAGLAALGFFVSWQFGTCFSWAARHVNLTGRLSSLLFIGKKPPHGPGPTGVLAHYNRLTNPV
jgi:hypothetical protein